MDAMVHKGVPTKSGDAETRLFLSSAFSFHTTYDSFFFFLVVFLCSSIFSSFFIGLHQVASRDQNSQGTHRTPENECVR